MKSKETKRNQKKSTETKSEKSKEINRNQMNSKGNQNITKIINL